MDRWAARMHGKGIDVKIQARNRVNPDGQRFDWRTAAMPPVTIVNGVNLTGILPFAIDWLHTTHPSTMAPKGIVLESLTLCHPQFSVVLNTVEVLELPVLVAKSDIPGLIAQVRSKHGMRTIE